MCVARVLHVDVCTRASLCVFVFMCVCVYVRSCSHVCVYACVTFVRFCTSTDDNNSEIIHTIHINWDEMAQLTL